MIYSDTNTVTSTAATVFVLTPVQPFIGGPLTLNDGSFSFTITGTREQSYRILYSTNLALPMTKWTQLGGGTFGGGAVSYADPSATNGARFYRIVSP